MKILSRSLKALTIISFFFFSSLLLTGCLSDSNSPPSSPGKTDHGYRHQRYSKDGVLISPQHQESEQMAQQQNTQTFFSSSEKVKVGLLLPLTGHAKELGKAMENASQLALSDHPENNITLITADTKSLSQGTQAAFDELLSKDVQIIIGPIYTQDLNAIRSKALEKKVPVLSLSNDPDYAALGVFIMGFNPNEQVDQIISYAIAQDKKRIAILAPETPYGKQMVQRASQKITALGGQVVATQTYSENTQNFSPILSKIGNLEQRKRMIEHHKELLATRAADDEESKILLEALKNKPIEHNTQFDAIFIAEGGEKLKKIAQQLSKSGIDTSKIKLLGTGLWDDKSLSQEPLLKGAWFAAPDHQDRVRYEDKYQRLYQSNPPRLSSLAYDATSLITAIVQQEGIQQNTFPVSSLLSTSGFQGVEGAFKLNHSGMVNHSLAIHEITSQGSEIVQPAVRHF